MNIVPLDKKDLDRAAEVLAQAFGNDALYAYFVPEEAGRAAFLARFMRFRLRYGLKYGKVFATEDLQGIAIWLPPGEGMAFSDVLRLGGLSAMLRAGRAAMNNVMAFNRFVDERSAPFEPQTRWTIAPVAVAPALQGRGYGGALLRHGLALLDAAGASCMLETQSAGNELMYRRFGFETVDCSAIPGTQVPNIIMCRNA